MNDRPHNSKPELLRSALWHMLNLTCHFPAQSLSKVGMTQQLGCKNSLLVFGLSLSAFKERFYILCFNFSDLSYSYLHSFTRTDLGLTLWEEYDIPKSYYRHICLKEGNI